MGTGPYFLDLVLSHLDLILLPVFTVVSLIKGCRPLCTSSASRLVSCHLASCLMSGYHSMFSNLLLLLIPTALPCDPNVLECSRKHSYYKVVVLSSRFDFKSNLLSLYL